MIPFKIDELTPCLKEISTGDIYETEVVKLKRKSFLSKFNSKTGWYINWSKFPETIDIYALVLKGTMDIQGLVALENEPELSAVHMVWACVSPENNIWEYGKKRFNGVGGHLFAIAGNKSVEFGHCGYIYGEAMDQEVFSHYINEYRAEPFPYGRPPHPFRFIIDEEPMKLIMEVYEYDDAGEEI